MKNKVSIIIVSWNGKKLLQDCIASIKKLTYKNYEIVISDNGSTDGSIEYVKKLKRLMKNITLVENGENLGFAEGNNVAVEKATGDLIFFLNNDAFVNPKCLEPLIKKLNSDKKIAAVQPKILCYPEKDVIDSAGSYFLNTGFLYHFGHNKKDSSKYNAESEVFSMKGAAMLYKKSVLDKIGVFDNGYFAYFEETDLCHRTWLAGYKILYIPTSEVYHKGGMTSKRMLSSFIQYHSYKNRIFTLLKNLEAQTLFKVMPIHMLFCNAISLLYLVTGQLQLFTTIHKAIWWNVFSYGKILQERKKIKKLRKVSDSKYLALTARQVGLDYYYHLFSTSLKGYQD